MMKLDRRLLWLSLIMMLLVSMTMISITSAPPPPEPYIYVDPAEVKNVAIDDWFLIYIKVNDAPDTWGWEVIVSWDPNLLELSLRSEGDFLKRGTYDTTFGTFPITPPYDEANARGYIVVSCMLAHVDDPWASGDGVLFGLRFHVRDEGSCLINLFDTRLYDNPDFPWLFTYYPNNDGFFYNVSPSHDIRITDVTVLTPEVLLGEVANINVTVLNEGTVTETGFTLNVKANETLINSTLITLDGTGNFEDRSFTHEVSWNTTGFTGVYTISAEVPTVSGEVDTADNTRIDGTVTVTVPAHDIAITNVDRFPTEVYVGMNTSIFVVVKNEGHFDETFNVTVKYNDTILETKTGIFLQNGTGTTLTFNWNTTDVAVGWYTINATATTVPGETDTLDNTKVDGTVHVKIVGDVNGDGTVDASDLFSLGKAYGTGVGETNWDPNCDFNGDGKVDFPDMFDLGENFGRSV